jgi:hypothetical protein
MKLRRGAVRCFVISVAIVIASPVKSAWTERGAGCWWCVPTALTTYECRQVSNNLFGDGIYCKENFLWVAQLCSTYGGGCYYTEVEPRPGGGGGGGSCTYENYYCPIECFDCGPPLF